MRPTVIIIAALVLLALGWALAFVMRELASLVGNRSNMQAASMDEILERLHVKRYIEAHFKRVAQHIFKQVR